MSIDTFIGIIALCVSCFLLGAQYGKDHNESHENKNDRPAPKVTVILK